jgi:aminoglycoside 6'-N-acetyltransferase I
MPDGARVVAADPDDPRIREEMARLLVEGVREMAPEAWPTLEAAREEVAQAFEPGRIPLVALDADGAVLGWIGVISTYDGHAWELHPLVVDPARHRSGIGRMLVAALEDAVRARGGGTMFLGTDDVAGWTSLAGVDVYGAALDHLRDLRDVHGHPFAFYRRLGYEVVGMIPDANGFGKPDIFMAKRVSGAGG